MRGDWHDLAELAVDPVDRTPLVSDGDVLRSAGDRAYPIVDGVPHLLPPSGLDADGWAYAPIVVGDVRRPKPTRRVRRWSQRLANLFPPVSDRGSVTEALRRELAERAVDGRRARVLVVGGATLREGLIDLAVDPRIDVYPFDIYPTPDTVFLADAHRIPMADASFDAVCAQAVLEHVYRPDVVVDEIRRVLRPGGWVYAETPFLQPVHEGAFDFTRFSVSGHALLFDGFDRVAIGPIGGPAACVGLEIGGLVAGLTRSSALGRVAHAATLPLRLLDRLVSPQLRRDHCLAAYYLGRSRVEGSGREPVDPVVLYEDAAPPCR